MKNLFLAVILALTVSSCSKVNDLNSVSDDSIVASRKQSNIPVSQVPVAVVNAFNTKYPSAGGEIEWQKEDGNTYKVKFWLGTERWQAIFNADGSFVSEKRLK